MTIDKRTLALAREWVKKVATYDDIPASPEGRRLEAAAEVIQALPDEFIDAAKVRDLLGVWRLEAATALDASAQSRIRVAISDLESLLNPPAPAVVVRMGAWAQHPEYGEVLITSDHPTPDGSVRVSVRARHFGDGATFDWVDHSDLSPLPDDDEPGDEPAPRIEAHHHTPQEPEDPVFDPAHMYLDQHGDEWRFAAEVGRWICEMRKGHTFHVEHDPPAEHGPYTRIEKRL